MKTNVCRVRVVRNVWYRFVARQAPDQSSITPSPGGTLSRCPPTTITASVAPGLVTMTLCSSGGGVSLARTSCKTISSGRAPACS
jgi:hypothetical protein